MVQSINYFLFFVYKKSLTLIWFIKVVFKNKTNKEKSTEICPPLLLKPTDYAYNAESKKGLHKVPILKKTTGLCLSIEVSAL